MRFNTAMNHRALSPAIPRSIMIENAAFSPNTLQSTLRALFAQHDLIVMRGAGGISDDELRQLGGMLGKGCSEVKKFAAQGPTGPAGQSRWHHVGNLAANRMADATVMVIREFPQSGGEFELVSNRLAWRNLDAEEQNRLRPLAVQHDFSSVRHTTASADDASRQGVLPLVGDLDGEPHLVLGYHATRINGMEDAESRLLLDGLMARATHESGIYRHHWQRGDLIAWRNIPLMHRSLGFSTAERRVIHEVTIRELIP